MKRFGKKEFFVVTILGVLTVLFFVFVIISQPPENKTEGRTNNPAQNIGETNDWDKALDLLHQGRVKQVEQSHNLDVVFVLENDESFTVKEPNIDDIFDEIQKCGRTCKDIEKITE